MALMTYREANQVLWRGVRPAHNGTQIFQRRTADNETTVIYTTPADQHFYLCHCSLQFSAIAAGRAIIRARTDAAAIWAELIYEVILATSDGKTTGFSYWPPIEFPYSYDIVVISNAVGLGLQGMVFGWVE